MYWINPLHKKQLYKVKIKMKYLKVFEDFIDKEEIKKQQDENELPIETIQDEDEVQDEFQGKDDDEVQDEVEKELKKEKEDLLEEIKRYYTKNKRRK
jgi:hypothetical protein